MQIHTSLEPRRASPKSTLGSGRQLEPRRSDVALRVAETAAQLASIREALRRSIAERRRLEAALASAVREERNRIARDIHDSVAQALTAVVVQLQGADAALGDGGISDARQHLQAAIETARAGLCETRHCVRGLRDTPLAPREFCTAAAELVKRMSAPAGLRGVFVVAGEPKKLPAALAANLLRIIQEGLTNVVRHARATQVDAELAFDPGAVRLTLRDDGCGFDPGAAVEGFGLLGMKERVAAMRGQITIASAAGRGTTTLVILPYR